MGMFFLFPRLLRTAKVNLGVSHTIRLRWVGIHQLDEILVWLAFYTWIYNRALFRYIHMFKDHFVSVDSMKRIEPNVHCPAVRAVPSPDCSVGQPMSAIVCSSTCRSRSSSTEDIAATVAAFVVLPIAAVVTATLCKMRKVIQGGIVEATLQCH